MAVHHFSPTHYFTSIGQHEPVLTVASGDTVVTTTVDSGGGDAKGVQVTERGNPMTGPFYVEGAEPGDTLAVTLDVLWPNRPFCHSRKAVTPALIDPAATRHLPWFDGEQVAARWSVDLDAGTATLVDPVDTALGSWTIPLRPMLGCFGTAPARGQTISTATSGPNGGNMDYNGHVQGVRNYLPVNVPGALFHLGDGHAIQGDGEISGSGLEISFDVEFTVEVIKGQSVGWPRGEDDEFIFTVGCARPLDQCVQHANTEMLDWLVSDWGFDRLGAHIFLCQVVTYDVGNIVDPAYTMVCKVPKAALAR